MVTVQQCVISAIIDIYDDFYELMQVTQWSAEITHNHPEGIKGAQATAAAAWMAKNNYPKKEIKDYIESTFDYNLNRTLDEIQPTYKHMETCQNSVPKAIICFLESNSFIDVIRNVMYIGGDCDTLGAIAGCIAENYYDIDDNIISKSLTYLPDELLSIVKKIQTYTNK